MVFCDENPVKEKYFETRIPESDRIAFSTGFEYIKDNITTVFSYTYLIFRERKITDSLQDGPSDVVNGDYKSTPIYQV